MPKGNEVSNLDNAITKARSEVDFALCRGPRAMEAREKRLAQIVCLLELAKHDHAATVAELRAKADAAERRVGELEVALRNLRDAFVFRQAVVASADTIEKIDFADSKAWKACDEAKAALTKETP